MAAILSSLAGCGGPSETTKPPTIRLSGSGTQREVSTCGVTATHAVYKAGAAVAFEGIAAADDRTTLTVFVRRCVDGELRTVQRIEVHHGRAGVFRGAFRVTVPSACYVQAVEGTRSSQRRYFVVE